MSALNTPINYKSLEEELYEALAADELYKLQNDAKIRAVEQGVPTYEHFRQMVNGAHLKPLERDDMKPKVGTRWNTAINVTNVHDSITSKVSERSKCDKGNNENIKENFSQTCEDFLRSWRTITDYSKRFTYMWNLRKNLHSCIFPVEIPALFFGDFIDMCLQYLSNVDDVTSITELLSILSGCNRFELTIYFIAKNERSACEQLFQLLRIKAKSQDKSLQNAIESLAARYRINLI